MDTALKYGNDVSKVRAHVRAKTETISSDPPSANAGSLCIIEFQRVPLSLPLRQEYVVKRLGLGQSDRLERISVQFEFCIILMNEFECSFS